MTKYLLLSIMQGILVTMVILKSLLHSLNAEKYWYNLEN